jgi:hypothetical protein
MRTVTLESLSQQLALADELREGRDRMLEPQDLPGRYGRVIKALDRVLGAVGAEAVVGGGWAVWRHGYVGRVTQDVDVVVPAAHVDALLRAAAVAGFQVLPRQPGRWPKLVHKETGITVDLLPEGERPGTPSKLAPTTLPHPARIGADGARLRYITLPALVELKLAAGRARDESDVIELMRANPDQADTVRNHLQTAHADYATAFDVLLRRASEQQDH